MKSKHCIDSFRIEVTVKDTPYVEIIDLNDNATYCFDYETTVLKVTSDQSDLSFYWDDFGRLEEG